MNSARRLLARLLAGTVFAVGVSVAFVGSASAHDVLISSNPTDGSTLKAVPSSVSFNFDQPVQNYDPVIALIGPDGKHYETGTAQVNGNTVTGTVSSGPAGAYIASYRIVSADGHPVTGEVHFTLAAGATPATGAASSGAGSSGTGSSGGGSSGGGSSGAGSGGTVVSAPVATASTGPASTSTAAASAPAGTKSGLSAWIWIALVVAALVIAAAAVILLRRPTGEKSADKDY